MNVKHSEYKQLTEQYVRGEGSPEERAFYEELMISEDSVLELYMQVLEELDSELPTLSNQDAFTDQVVNHKSIKPYRRKISPWVPERQKRWYERAMFHYTIAASITMLFLFTGTFDRLHSSELQDVTPLSDTPSYSEQLMEKTTSWLDQLLSR